MSTLSVAPRRWPQRRWWIVVSFIFVLQLGLIFGLSDRRLIQPRQRGSAPSLHVVRSGATELLALSDPTLFALPHRQGFSGLAWLEAPPPESRSFDWSEDPCFLQLSTQRLGSTIGCVVDAAAIISLVSPARPKPALTLAGTGPPPPAPAKPRLRLEDGLAGRILITPLELPLEQHTDLLTPTVVQVVVDSEGLPIAVPILLSKSGSSIADKDALQLARIARFNPIASGGPRKAVNPTAELTWGRMIFEWQTLPMAVTNAVSTGR